jgi:sec-independent protein translocase protein TatB
MFLDIAPSEFLLTAIVAVVVIGPKDLPRAMRTAGKWMGKMRRVSGHFRSGIETMIREAELEDMEKKWREQNEAIMKATPPAAELPAPEVAAHAPTEPLAHGEAQVTQHDAPHTHEASAPSRPEILS